MPQFGDSFLLACLTLQIAWPCSADPCASTSDYLAPRCRCIGDCNNDPDNTIQPNRQVNIAFNHPAGMSSGGICTAQSEKYCKCEDELWGSRISQACAALNGRKDWILSYGCFYDKPVNCIKSDGDDYSPWWFVDLTKRYTITWVNIHSRQYVDGPSDDDWQYFFGVVIYVDAKACYAFPTYGETTAMKDVMKEFQGWADRGGQYKFDLKCHEPYRGQWVKVQKDTKAPGDTGLKQLQFCEVQIFACSSGQYNKFKDTDSKRPLCVNCPSSSTCLVPCDNVFGCDGMFSLNNNNLAIHKLTTAKTEVYSSFPADQATDGVGPRGNKWCYTSRDVSTASQPQWLRVDLEDLSLIYKVTIQAFFQNPRPFIQGASVRLSRYASATGEQLGGNTLCWKYPSTVQTGETFPEKEYSQICQDCQAGKEYGACPLARYVTVVGGASGTHLKLCELEVYGQPIEELELNYRCGDCNLTMCSRIKDLVCHDHYCKAKTGGQCAHEAHCLPDDNCETGICKTKVRSDCPVYGLCETGTACSWDGSLNKTTCKKLNGRNCDSSNECGDQGGTMMICDLENKCKLPVGSECRGGSSCVVGAICVNNTCQCDGITATTSGVTCAPVVYNISCSGDAACTAFSALPHFACISGRCQCASGFRKAFDNLTCVAFVASCTSHDDCSPGQKCELTVCRLDVGSACNNNSVCIANATCDMLGHLCKIMPGKPCENTEECYTGTSCSDTCQLFPGRECSIAPDACPDGYVCNTPKDNTNRKCLVAVDGECDAGNSNLECGGESVCDQFRFPATVCKVDVLQSCAGDLQDKCRHEAECRQGICYWRAGVECTNTTQCGPDRVCDVDKKCRLNKGQDCGDFPLHCRLRTYCDVRTCVCLKTTNDDSDCGLTDEKKVVTSACEVNTNSTGSCNDTRYARCDWIRGRCVCEDGFAPHVDLTCLPGVGSPCRAPHALDTEARCAFGTVCDVDNHCKKAVAQRCFGEHRIWCQAGTVCDQDHHCRLIEGESCAGDKEHSCRLDLICDILHTCSAPVKGACQRNMDCVAGAKCVAQFDGQTYDCQCDKSLARVDGSGRQCEPIVSTVGEQCQQDSTGTCTCDEGYKPSRMDFQCKLAEGSGCDDDDECNTGLVCDSEKSVCKPGLGSRCEPGDNGCSSQYVCDVDKRCKLDMGANCADNEDLCRMGFHCDILGFCKRTKDFFCNDSAPGQYLECPAGAKCLEYKCQCNPDVTVSSTSGWCEPKAGRPGGRCKLWNLCDVPTTFCDKTTMTCQCLKGYHVNSVELDCYGGNNAKASLVDSSTDWTPLMIGVGAACAVLGIAVVGVWSRGRDHKREAMLDEMNSRRASMSQLRRDSMLVAKETESEAARSLELALALCVADPEGSTVDIPANMEGSSADVLSVVSSAMFESTSSMALSEQSHVTA